MQIPSLPGLLNDRRKWNFDPQPVIQGRRAPFRKGGTQAQIHLTKGSQKSKLFGHLGVLRVVQCVRNENRNVEYRASGSAPSARVKRPTSSWGPNSKRSSSFSCRIVGGRPTRVEEGIKKGAASVATPLCGFFLVCKILCAAVNTCRAISTA